MAEKMRHGVIKQAIVACRPVRPEDYPPDRLWVWKAVERELGVSPVIHPGSMFQSCEECGIEVAVGPRQQDKLIAYRAQVLCMICAVEASVAPFRGRRD